MTCIAVERRGSTTFLCVAKECDGTHHYFTNPMNARSHIGREVNMETTIRTLPELDQSTAARLGDEILIEAGKSEKVKKVKSGGATGVRAWSRGGSVD